MVCWTFDKIKNYVEEKGCQLVTTQEDYIQNKLNTKSNMQFISICGHLSITTFNNFKYLNTGILCKQCRTISVAKQLKEINSNCNKSYEILNSSLEIMQEMLDKQFFFEVMNEGTLASFSIKPKDVKDNIWLPVKIKTTAQRRDSLYSYSFKVKPNYYNMPVVLFAVSDMKIWLMNGNDINLESICIGTKRSVYDKYFVKCDDLYSKLNTIYESHLFNQTLEQLNNPISKQSQLSQKYVKLREQYINFLEFKYPKYGYKEYDFVVNNLKIQEKVAVVGQKANLYVVNLQRSMSVYKAGDNDFYWIHIPETKHFYIFPENILIDNEVIGDEVTLPWLYLYPEYINKKDLNIKHEWQFDFLYSYDDLNIDKIQNIFKLPV